MRVPIVYMDCVVAKVRRTGQRNQQSRLPALGINTEGQKELLGMWLAENECEKFCCCVDGAEKLRGLPGHP